MTKLTFFGHSCFSLADEKTKILIDPFFTGNPLNQSNVKDIEADYIFVTHAHADHLGDAVEISQRTNATIISTFEVANLCEAKGCKVHAMHIGGKTSFPFGLVRVTHALHGAGIAGGHACGFIIHFNKHTIYHAGDTGVFYDMKLLGTLEKIDYALLPIGGNFTMDPDDAVYAAELLRAKNVIPMHYNTWPPIEQDAEVFKSECVRRSHTNVLIMQPNSSIEL